VPYVSHQLIVVRSVETACQFYESFVRLTTTHRRNRANGQRIAWLGSSGVNHRLIVVEGPPLEEPIGPYSHVGVSCSSRSEYEDMLNQCQSAQLVSEGPRSQEWPICEWFAMRDPDGNRVEVSWGQDQFNGPPV